MTSSCAHPVLQFKARSKFKANFVVVKFKSSMSIDLAKKKNEHNYV
jgi:hypothetical protein